MSGAAQTDFQYLIHNHRVAHVDHSGQARNEPFVELLARTSDAGHAHIQDVAYIFPLSFQSGTIIASQTT